MCRVNSLDVIITEMIQICCIIRKSAFEMLQPKYLSEITFHKCHVLCALFFRASVVASCLLLMCTSLLSPFLCFRRLTALSNQMSNKNLLISIQFVRISHEVILGDGVIF